MGKEVRSIRYFDGLFMKAEEFIQEQNYHTRMRRLHNRYLHSSGIVWGLEIQKSKKPGANPADVTVTQGMALNIIEEDGEEVSKEIILTDDTDVSLSSYGAGKSVYIYISYSRESAPKDSEDSKNIHWLEEGKLVSGTDRSKINEDENILLGKVSLITANGAVTVDKIDYEDTSGSLRKYAGFSGKSLQTEKIILAINGVTSGFASIEGKQIGTNNGIQVNSPITSFVGALSIGDKLGVGGNVQLPDNKSLILGTTNPVSLHNNNAAPELWLEATGQASSALAIGTAFDLDKQVKFKYTPGAVGAAAGELRIGQDVKTAGTGTFTHGITTLYTNGLERLSIDSTGNVIIKTGNLKILGIDTFLDFGTDMRQMLNLGNGCGVGVQTWTQYYRSTGNFAWYIGGAHNDAELNPGGGTVAMIIKRVSGNVGIGTINPPQKLSVSGLESSAHGMGAAIGISNAAPGGANWYLRAGATGTSTPESGFSIADDIAYRLVIDKSGNVGIGTTAPTTGKLQFANALGNKIVVWDGGAADRYGIGLNGGNLNVFIPGGSRFSLRNNGFDGAEQFVVTGAGSVGIGNANPQVKLSIGGIGANVYATDVWIENNMHIQGNETLAQGGRGRLRVGTAWGYMGLFTEGSSSGAVNDLILGASSGRIRIGPDGGGQNLYVNGDIAILGKHAFRGNDTWLRLNQDGAFASGVHTPGVFAPMSLNVGGAGSWGNPGAGNVWVVGTVGIGTTTPQVKFHVVGNRIRLQKGNGHNLDMRADGSAFDIESLDEDLYINNISNTSVRIKNFVNISSRDLKENFSELSGKEAFETLENLNPLRFQYKGDSRGELHLGFIAEDVSGNVATADRKGINPMAIIAVLTRVVKEQQKMILTLQESIGFAK